MEDAFSGVGGRAINKRSTLKVLLITTKKPPKSNIVDSLTDDVSS